MIIDIPAMIGMINKSRLAIFQRRLVAAAVPPVILFPVPTGSIFARGIINPGQVISSTPPPEQRSVANAPTYKEQVPKNKRAK